MASFYEKLAKAGWLGTRAQVSEQYGNPSWKTPEQQGDSQDAVAEALRKRIKQAATPNSSDTSGS